MHLKRLYRRVRIACALGTLAGFFCLLLLPVAAISGSTPGIAPSAVAVDDIPPVALAAYQRATQTCPGVSWELLAGIGKVESDHGRIFAGSISPTGDVTPLILGVPLDGTGRGGNITPIVAGRWAGQWGLGGTWMRAVGPMQFLPPTFAAHARDGNGDAVLNPHNIFDAAATAARYLCSSQGGTITDTRAAVATYNRSTAYVDDVHHWAALYRLAPGLTVDPSALLHHPNVELSPAARADLEAGIVAPGLVATLAWIAQDFTIYISVFRTGHSQCVGGGDRSARPQCTISRHWYGAAADIAAVGRVGDARIAVTPRNAAARALVDRLGALPMSAPLRPHGVGSPWATGYAGHFTDRDHQDHVHCSSS